MLKQRLLTAAILIPLVVLGIFLLPNPYLAVILAFIVAIGAWEWSGLIDLQRFSRKIVYVGIVIVSLVVFAFIARYSAGLQMILWLSLLWWLVALLWIIGFRGDKQPRFSLWSGAIAGILVLVPCWVSLVTIHSTEHGPVYLLFIMAIIWIADSGAYFVGRRWGRRKLAPRVSPGKSWEGVAGGLMFVAIFSFVSGVLLFEYSVALSFVFALLCLTVALFSVEGDLLESMFKRRAGVKDSGTILPGHGGVLDRIDSLTAAAPLFLLGLLIGDFI